MFRTSPYWLMRIAVHQCLLAHVACRVATCLPAASTEALWPPVLLPGTQQVVDNLDSCSMAPTQLSSSLAAFMHPLRRLA